MTYRRFLRFRIVCFALLAAAAAAGSLAKPKEDPEKVKRSQSLDLLEEGQKLEKQGLFQQAIQRYLSAEAVAPSPQIYYRVGRCFSRLQDYQTACAYLQKALEGVPDYKEARYELENAQAMLGAVAPAPLVPVRAAEPPQPIAVAAAPAALAPPTAETSGAAPTIAPATGVKKAPPKQATAAGAKQLALSDEEPFRPRKIRPAAASAKPQAVRTRVTGAPAAGANPAPFAAPAPIAVPPLDAAVPAPAPVPAQAPVPLAERPEIRQILPAHEEPGRWEHLVDKPMPPAGATPPAEAAAPLSPGPAASQEASMQDIYKTLFGERDKLAKPTIVREPSGGKDGDEGAPTYLREVSFHMDKGDTLMSRGEYKKAADEYLEALRLDERCADARVRLGEAYLALGESENAEAQLLRAAEMAPADTNAAYRLAELYFKDQNYNKAVTEAERAVQLDNQDDEALLLLGDIYAKMGRQAKAEQLYMRAGQLKPESPRPFWKMGNLRLDVKDFAQAKTLYEKAISLAPSFVPARNNLGYLYHLEGNYVEAEKTYKKVIELDPKFAKAYFNLAMLYEGELKKPGEAVKCYNKYISLGGPRADEARAAIADIKARQ